MDPITTAALVSAGGSILGGLIGRNSGAVYSREAMNEDTDYWMRKSIQYRAEDAKNAGLHPLYALSGGPAPQMPGVTVDNSKQWLGSAVQQAGQDIGRAMAQRMTPEQKALHDANVTALRTRAFRDFQEGQYWASRAMRGQIESNESQDASGPVVGEDVITGKVASPGKSYVVKPAEVKIAKESAPHEVLAPASPGWKRQRLWPGRFGNRLVPDSDESWAESIEGLVPATAFAIMNAADLLGISFKAARQNWDYIRSLPQVRDMVASLHAWMERTGKGNKPQLRKYKPGRSLDPRSFGP